MSTLTLSTRQRKPQDKMSTLTKECQNRETPELRLRMQVARAFDGANRTPLVMRSMTATLATQDAATKQREPHRSAMLLGLRLLDSELGGSGEVVTKLAAGFSQLREASRLLVDVTQFGIEPREQAGT